MRLISRRGQSIGEYAILFGIVLGAVIAMQGYIRMRIAGTIKQEADLYGGGAPDFSPNITSNSTSTTDLNMADVRSGAVQIDSTSSSTTMH